MRQAAPIQNPPLISSPPTPLTSPPPLSLYHHHSNKNLFISIFLALFLSCLGMTVVFLVYILLLWFATRNNQSPLSNNLPSLPANPVDEKKGLSQWELEKLPRATGEDIMVGDGKCRECVVCLEEMKGEQPVLLVPGCFHGFHFECADTWLSRHPMCPVCRANVYVCSSSNANDE